MRRRRTLTTLAVALVTAIGFGALQATGGAAKTGPVAAAGCQLGNGIKHVIYVQFDNTHFRRDNANVPSDLEQMPHLLNFIRGNGTLLTNDHTVLISHTATGILSTLTGVYPDRMGQPVSNSFRYFKTDGTTRTGVSFAYWTAPLFDPAGSTTDTTPEMINENGKISPAPWVPYTRAGCDFGAVATAPKSQPARVYGTHGAGAVLPFSLIISGVVSPTAPPGSKSGAVQYAKETPVRVAPVGVK